MIVEDEYFLADDLTRILRAKGAEVVGPTRTVEQTVATVRGRSAIDAALVDLNLRGEISFDIADALIAEGIPFIFVTGYDVAVIPERYRHIARYEKPVDIRLVADHVVAMAAQPKAPTV